VTTLDFRCGKETSDSLINNLARIRLFGSWSQVYISTYTVLTDSPMCSNHVVSVRVEFCLELLQ